MKFPMDHKRFGRLTVIARSVSPGLARWDCVCDCGNVIAVKRAALSSGHTKSCGCFKSQRLSDLNKARTTHGASSSSTYHTWQAMHDRCANPNNKHYKNYGGRGIKVCVRWREFSNFLADMGHRPAPALTLDRRNNDGNYSPSNCRWVSRSVNNYNRRPSSEWKKEIRA